MWSRPVSAALSPPLQLGVLPGHVPVEIVLPLNQLLAVADDFLGGQTVVRREGHEGYVHVRGFFVQVNHRGKDGFRPLALGQKVQGMAEIGADFLRGLAAKELGAAGHQGFHQADAVRPGAAACLGDLAFRLRPVMSARFYQVDVQVAAAGIHIRVAGVAFLGALVVGLDPADLRALVLGEAQNGVHGLADKAHLLSVFWKKTAYIRTCVPPPCTYVRSHGRYA